MNKVLKEIIKSCVVFVSFFFPPRIVEIFSIRFNLLYTLWQAQEFRSYGDDLFISSPINIKGGKYISIKDNVSIGKNSIINAWDEYENEAYNPLIIIGNNTYLGEECHISAINKIVIGDNVLTGRRVLIVDNSHGNSSVTDFLIPPSKRKLSSRGPVIIEDNVWIGDKVSILSGVVIGENSIIGANSVVTKNVPANSIVGGIPARIIKVIS